ncbi:hypothetical protein ACF0H5_001240 [Mactra antiquata]
MKALSDSKNPVAKIVMTGWAFLECLLFSGTLYGWSSLVYVLKDEGIYDNLCNDSLSVKSLSFDSNGSHLNHHDNNILNIVSMKTLMNTTSFVNNSYKHSVLNETSPVSMDAIGKFECEAQDKMLSLCFTISSSLYCISCAVMGHINFKLGTRRTRYIAFSLFTIGAVCLAFVSQELPWLIFPGLTLIGIGGLPLFVTNNQISKLFLKGGSTVVGLLCGSYDMSAGVYLVVKLLYQHGFRRRDIFLVLTGMHVLTLISTRKFLPEDFIEQKTVIEKKTMEIRVNDEAVETLIVKQRRASRRPSIADIQPLKSYLRQPLFITHIIWLCLLTLRFYYFVGNLNPFLNRVLENDNEKVSYFTDVCFYTMMGGLLTSFLVGIVYDGQTSCFKNGKTKLYRSLMPALLPLSLASIFGIIMSILALTPTVEILYCIFIVMVLCRSFLYSMAAAFIIAIFPSRYFGILYGVTMVSAGVFSLLNYALFSWAATYPEAPFHVDVFLLVVSILSIFHPVCMWICGWREERKNSQ